MKPCSRNRKRLALLAADALSANEQRDLDAHIQTCAGCRAYLAEISSVAQKLGAIQTGSEIQTSEPFHQKVVRALRAEEASMWTSSLTSLCTALFNWRIALPLAAVAALIVTALVLFTRPSTVAPPPIVQANPPNVKTDLDPTLSNYQMIANRSLENFDELLTKQANKNPAPGPVYTASMIPGREVLD